MYLNNILKNFVVVMSSIVRRVDYIQKELKYSYKYTYTYIHINIPKNIHINIHINCFTAQMYSSLYYNKYKILPTVHSKIHIEISVV